MYRYDNYDHQMLEDRIAQFRDQTARFLKGDLADTEFLPLRLQNGLYIQRLAPMLRIAIPYGMLSSTQLRKLAYISEYYDKGYGTSPHARISSLTGLRWKMFRISSNT